MSAVDELARRWADAGGAADAVALPDTSGEAIALAWALKELCYAAWSSAPRDAGLAAQALAALWQRAGHGPIAADELKQIEALASWTQAIAQLTQGAMREAIASLDHAAELFRQLGRTADAAQTRVPCIMALSMLGRHDDAVACAENAQRLFTELGDKRAAAKVTLNLGSLHLRHDAYDAAARHYRQAAVLFARIADHQHSVMADIGVADALAALGDVDEARNIGNRARMRAAAHGFPVLEAMVDESMALLDLAGGQVGDALAGFENSRCGYERLDMPQHLAIAEKQLADAYLELRLLPEALRLYETALARMRALDMPDDAAATLAQRGRAQALLRRFGPAALSFKQAEQLHAAQHSEVGTAAVLLARADLALAQGDAATARAQATQAADGFRAAGMVGACLQAELTVTEALLNEGDAAASRSAFDRLLTQALSLQMLSAQVRCLTGQGRAAMAQQDDAAARAAFGAAVDLSEEQQRALPGDDVRTAFLADRLRPYEAMLRFAVHDHARQPTPRHAAEVLRWVDKVRARALGERLARGRAEGAQAEPVPAMAALRSRLNWLSRRLQRQHDDGESPPTLEQALRDTEQALLELSRRERLARRVRQGEADPFDDEDIAAALARLLLPDDAVVEFGVVDGALFACIVRPAGVEVVHGLASLTEVTEALQAARFQIEALRHGAALLTPHLPRLTERTQVHLRRLHALLWAPLAASLHGVQRVLVVAPAALVGLPFAALHDGRQSLGERHALAVAPSARWACHALARVPAVPRSALVVGESGRLLHAEAEIRAVAALFATNNVTVLQGEAATFEALQRHAARADVLHLACHAEFRSDNPMFSALHLDSGPLTAERIETLAPAPGIVVLSACETGLAGATEDEHVGLVRAFFIAGAVRVLASLWPVDDAVTAIGMTAFHRALLAGQPAATALREAQAAVKLLHPHPYFWAAFTLYGGW